MTNHDTPRFVRRKFTITESLDEELTRLAERHYQGNVSHCIRAAIEDHRATLGGDGSVAVQRLTREVASLRDRAESIQAAVEDIDHDVRGIQQSQRTERGVNVDLEGTPARLIETLVGVENGLRLEDLFERLELPPAEIQSALGRLVDYGYVHEENGSGRYSLVGGSTENVGERGGARE